MSVRVVVDESFSGQRWWESLQLELARGSALPSELVRIAGGEEAFVTDDERAVLIHERAAALDGWSDEQAGIHPLRFEYL